MTIIACCPPGAYLPEALWRQAETFGILLRLEEVVPPDGYDIPPAPELSDRSVQYRSSTERDKFLSDVASGVTLFKMMYADTNDVDYYIRIVGDRILFLLSQDESLEWALVERSKTHYLAFLTLPSMGVLRLDAEHQARLLNNATDGLVPSDDEYCYGKAQGLVLMGWGGEPPRLR